jgi:hypothetical protein
MNPYIDAQTSQSNHALGLTPAPEDELVRVYEMGNWAEKGWTSVPRSEGDGREHWTCTQEDETTIAITSEFPLEGELAPFTCGEPKPAAPGIPLWVWALGAGALGWMFTRGGR